MSEIDQTADRLREKCQFAYGKIKVSPVDLLDVLDELRTTQRAARTLGRTLDRWGNAIIEATGSQDLVDETGDGDWELIEERLAQLRSLNAGDQS